jgi:hypothetical protein
MPLARIDSETLRQTRDMLMKTAAFEKRAALLEAEVDVYRRVLDLVAKGQLDPEVAIEKVAEFKGDSDRLRIFEAATSLNYGSVKLGTAVDDVTDGPSGADTPEGKLVRAVERITADTGNY